jgi:Skp family chaperone for outer membrane proteins
MHFNGNVGSWAGRAAALAVIGFGLLIVPAVAKADKTSAAVSVSVKPVMGVIDLQAILAKSLAARKIAGQREGYLNTYQAVVAEKEKELRAIDQKLAADRAQLDAATFGQRRADFQAQVSAFQKQVEVRRRALERAYTQAMNEVQATVIRLTQETANARGMNVIVYRSQVFLFDPSMDITEPVLAAVNKALPSVTMPDPDSLPVPKENN